MNKTIRAISAAIIVALWVALTGFAWFGPSKDISEAERRPLQQMPEISVDTLLNGNFMGTFEDYTLDEMQQIFYKMAEKKGLILEQGSEQAVRGMIENAKKGTADLGNARGVRNLLENCIRRKDSRIASSLREGKALENEELLTLRKEDLL